MHFKMFNFKFLMSNSKFLKFFTWESFKFSELGRKQAVNLEDEKLLNVKILIVTFCLLIIDFKNSLSCLKIASVRWKHSVLWILRLHLDAQGASALLRIHSVGKTHRLSHSNTLRILPSSLWTFKTVLHHIMVSLATAHLQTRPWMQHNWKVRIIWSFWSDESC